MTSYLGANRFEKTFSIYTGIVVGSCWIGCCIDVLPNFLETPKGDMGDMMNHLYSCHIKQLFHSQKTDTSMEI